MLEEKLAELGTAVCFKFLVYLFTEGREIKEDVESTVWLVGEDAVVDKLLCDVAADGFGNPSLV